VEPILANVSDAAALETAIAAQAREPNGSLIIMPDTFLTVHRAKIAALAAQHKLPAVYWARLFVAGGGLVSYGNVPPTTFGVQRLMPIASFRAKNRSTFLSRRRSSWNWRSISRPPRPSDLLCRPR
jgi:hypothetical protein